MQFQGMRQMHSHMYLPLQSHTGAVHCLKNPVFSLFIPPQRTFATFIFLLAPSFCLFQNVLQLEVHIRQPFQAGFFNLAIYLRSLRVFSILLSNVSLHDYPTDYPFIPTKGYLGCFQVLTIMYKVVVNIHVQVFVQT